MDKSVAKYRKRRMERLGTGSNKIRLDSVELYRKRREKRLTQRFDAGQGWVFGALKARGVDTSEMDLGEAFKAWNELNEKEGKSPAKGRLTGKRKKENTRKGQENRGAKRYVGGESASSAKEIGGYKRKNNFKNGYGNTDVWPESREDLVNGKTMHDNTNENGEWTEEREALHSRIIDNTFNGVKKASGKPVTVFMGGGPASGKSYVVKAFGDDFGLPKDSVLADPDDCKKELPEYDPNAPWLVHEESSALAKRITKLAQDNGYNTVVDGTGDGSVASMRKKIKQARDAGNVVNGRYVFMPVEDAIKLNHKRDRSVSPERLVETHRRISSILPEIAADFDNVELYANILGGKPKLIARGGGGKPLEVLDKWLYKKFLDNGEYVYNKEKVKELERSPSARKRHIEYKPVKKH